MAFGDKYALEVPLGESELGTVWAAKEPTGRKVVIAVLEDDAPDALKAHVLALGGVLSGFTHPNVVRVFEAGTNEQGASYLVMERLEGTSLAKRWEASPALRADRTIELGIGIVDGLTKLHEVKLPSGEPVVHGDLEPGNVILVGAPGKEVPKLIGFVLNRSAKRNDPGARVSLATMQPLAYAAPEQASGAVTSSVSADLYSAAAILFAGLTGRPPHVGSDARSLADAIAKDAAPLFASLRKDLTPFAATIDRALAVDPKRRYADGGALGRALRTALAMGRVVGSKETPVGKRSAIAVEGASAATIPGSTRLPSRTPPRPAETEPSPRGLAPPTKPEATNDETKPPETKPPEATTEKTAEAPGKASETAAKASETAAKASEAPAKASEAPGKAPEAAAKASEAPAKASTPDADAKAEEADDIDGLPSSELELVSGETSLPPTLRPPPPPEARGSVTELASGELELEPALESQAKSPTPGPAPTTVGEKKDGAAPEPAAAGRFAPPATSSAPHSAQSVVQAAPAVDGWIASEPTPEPLRSEPPGPPAPTPPPPSASISDLADDEPVAANEPAAAPHAFDDDGLVAANGPPRWLLVALSVTVLLLGGILTWMRLGQAPSSTPTESLGAILDAPPLDRGSAPATLAPPSIAPPTTIAPPLTAPPATTIAPPVTAPPATFAPAVTSTPPATTLVPAPLATTSPRVSGTASPTGIRTTTGTTSGTRTTSPATGTRTPGSGTRTTSGTRTSATGMATTGMSTATTGMSSGRTTVVTDPGF